ncbi:sigma-54 dependent transcriptional regulator [Thioalkalivibrio sp. XN279]|uniref:sigma-54-dependent transcriptional regulator n=1 Tax=Thioalkalivibrio sp. XN279 TaxID=2714953 RepID=UPI00140BDCA9|nr:sigma-54 dependent transcriptional regulator [Thioalkalivibrio sp. XN279]NHA15429.1 sigma-54-dependent Fis family transcriptional regulator [Thioalkalivibrio sp. XN279]
MSMPDATARPRILVVEDDDGLRDMLRNELDDAGYETLSAADAAAARGLVEQQSPDLVLSDLRLPGDSGQALLAFCRQLEAPPAFIMITAFGTVEQAVEALKQGADDFLTKPLRLDHLRLAVARALESRRLRSELSQYRRLLSEGEFHGMLGRSPPMRELYEVVRRVAPLASPVIISGESGTGKELVARALHAESPRSAHAFVPLNCAAVPAELMESELFGHARGAFTGATRQRDGLFAEADGGTLLLDEIGEMPAGIQAKLLRVLEDGCIRPLGTDSERQVDVRLLAATNRDLEAEVAAGRFRADLFYRLETFQVRVPALRERGDDLDLLAAHFVARCAAARGQRPPALSDQALACLRAYEFPGNVRELANALERATVFCGDREIRPAHLPERMRRRRPMQPSAAAPGAGIPGGQDPLEVLGDDPDTWPSLDALERRYIRQVLDRVDGNKRRAAEILGIARRTLYRRLDDM